MRDFQNEDSKTFLLLLESAFIRAEVSHEIYSDVNGTVSLDAMSKTDHSTCT